MGFKRRARTGTSDADEHDVTLRRRTGRADRDRMRRVVRSRRRMIVFVIACLARSAPAQEVPTEPLLRVETGGHAAPIFHAGIDAAGKVLVTGSFDKTLRMWSLPSGKLLRVL